MVGVRVKFEAFKTSELGVGEWSASCYGVFNSGERVPCTHWIGDWADTRTGLNAVVKRKIPALAWNRNKGM
jgi:hypothetical protein